MVDHFLHSSDTDVVVCVVLILVYPMFSSLVHTFCSQGLLVQLANPVFALLEPTVAFKKKLQDVEVKEKETAMLLCEVPMPSTQASWFMEETRLEQSSTKYRMEQEGTLRRLTIHNVTTNDDAVYICEMKEGSRTVAELTVLGIVLNTKSSFEFFIN